MAALVRYRSVVFDSARWEGFAFRPDDIVISTPPKCGTTWMQTLCAMLVLDAAELDRPLAELSPWLDMQTNDLAQVVAALDGQAHRRFIKTHTPLDGLPQVDGVTYVCVARDPRDVAISFQHHSANLDVAAFMEARARAVGLEDLAALGLPPEVSDDPAERFAQWVEAERNTFVGPSLTDVLHHAGTFWDHRDQEGVVLFHYSDLLADLRGQLRRLADALGVTIEDDRIDRFADAATFERMRARADELVPDVGNRIWKSNESFFHHGTNGQWRDVVDEGTLRRYDERVRALAPPDLAAWVHGGWSGAADPLVAQSGR